MAGFEQVIRLQLERLKPAEVKKAHIAAAKKGLVEFMRRQDQKPGYTIETDGRAASSEQSVRPYGVIAYRFVRLSEITRSALAAAILASPRRSGRYRRSWFAMVNGAEVEETKKLGPEVREILVTNDQPYSRKINVGAKGFKAYAPPGVVEKVKEQMKRRFGNIAEFRVIYITIEGGHVLRHDQYRRDKFGRRRGGPRRDARAGASLTYPALRVSMR